MRPPKVGTPCPTVSAIQFSAKIDAKEKASLTPRIEDLNASRLEVGGVARFDCHALHKRGRGIIRGKVISGTGEAAAGGL